MNKGETTEVDAGKITAIVTLLTFIGGLLGAGVGWCLRALSSIGRREDALWQNMQEELAEKRREVREIQERERILQIEKAALYQTNILLSQENSTLKTQVTMLEGEKAVHLAISPFR